MQPIGQQPPLLIKPVVNRVKTTGFKCFHYQILHLPDRDSGAINSTRINSQNQYRRLKLQATSGISILRFSIAHAFNADSVAFNIELTVS